MFESSEQMQFEKVKKYLIKLGYPSKTIHFEYLAKSRKYIDIVIKSNDTIIVVIEVKNKSSLNFNNYEEIGYHPIARKLQKDAKELNSEYYILSNGSQHIWLRTGITGRPEPIEAIPYNSFNQSIISESNYIKNTLFQIEKLLKHNPITQDFLFDISLILYAKLIRESENIPNNNIVDLQKLMHNTFQISFKNNIYSEKNFQKALYIFEQDSIQLIKHKKDVIQFIDELFENNSQDWNIPRWLSDFMIKLLNINSDGKLLNLFARNGTITSSAYLNNKSNIISYYINSNHQYWIKSLQLLFNDKINKPIYQPELVEADFESLNHHNADGILIAPPFNLKINNLQDSEIAYNGIKDSTSIYLEKTIDMLSPNGKTIAIIPDSILVSSKFIKVREYLLSRCNIEAVISLPSKTFMPNSNVKTSLIILSKKSTHNKLCFIAAIDDIPKISSLSCSDNEILNEILETKLGLENNKNIKISKNGFYINKLDVNNFHFSKYWFTNNYSDNMSEGYPLVPLKELIVTIQRGNALKIDDNGDIPFVNPANVRSMELLKEYLNYTSKEKLPKNIKKIESGQILINMISTYRGCAAIVTNEFEGLAINTHLVSIQPKTNIVDTGYLAFALNSNFVKTQFLENSYGSTIPSLNLKSFEEIFIPLPSIEKQKEIYNEFIFIQNQINTVKINLSKLEFDLNEKLQDLGKVDM